MPSGDKRRVQRNTSGYNYQQVTPKALYPEDDDLTDDGLIDRNRERALVGSLTNSYNFKKGGLIKKTMSIIVNGSPQHLISYYTKDDVLSGRLATPSSIPELSQLEISPELFLRQSFRVPPMMERGGDIFDSVATRCSPLSPRSSSSSSAKSSSSSMMAYGMAHAQQQHSLVRPSFYSRDSSESDTSLLIGDSTSGIRRRASEISTDQPRKASRTSMDCRIYASLSSASPTHPHDYAPLPFAPPPRSNGVRPPSLRYSTGDLTEPTARSEHFSSMMMYGHNTMPMSSPSPPTSSKHKQSHPHHPQQHQHQQTPQQPSQPQHSSPQHPVSTAQACDMQHPSFRQPTATHTASSAFTMDHRVPPYDAVAVSTAAAAGAAASPPPSPFGVYPTAIAPPKTSSPFTVHDAQPASQPQTPYWQHHPSSHDDFRYRHAFYPPQTQPIDSGARSFVVQKPSSPKEFQPMQHASELPTFY